MSNNGLKTVVSWVGKRQTCHRSRFDRTRGCQQEPSPRRHFRCCGVQLARKHIDLYAELDFYVGQDIEPDEEGNYDAGQRLQMVPWVYRDNRRSSRWEHG